MAYVFDPINNTLIDDEDKSLGNKLALNDNEFQKLLDIPGVFRASEAPQPPPRPDVQEIEAINRFIRDNPVEKAEGGRLKAAGPLLFAPAVASKIGTLLGITGVTGLALQRKIQNFAENNPDFFDNILKSIGYTGEGQVFGPSTEDIIEAKPQIVSTPDKPEGLKDYRESFGDDELAKSLLKTKPETFPAGDDIKPVVEGFPADTEKLPIIFENKKTDLKDLQKNFNDKSWRDTTVITGAGATRKSVGQKTNVPFFEKLEKYSKDYHGGNLKAAIKEIGNIQVKPGVRDKQLESLYTTITNAAKRSDFTFDAAGKTLISNIPKINNPVDFNVITNTLKRDPNSLNNRIKELNIDKDKVLNKIEILDAIGAKTDNTRTNNFVMELLQDQGLKYIDLPGGRKGFKFNDAIKTIKDYSKNKLTNYEARSTSENLRESSKEKLKYRLQTDEGLVKFMYELNKNMRKNLIPFKDERAYIPNSTAEAGHNPVPVNFIKNVKFLKNKDVQNKLFSIQNMTWQFSEVNRDLLRDTQGGLLTHLQTLDKYFGKTKTEKNAAEIDKAAEGIVKYFDSLPGKLKNIKNELYDGDFVEENTFGKLVFNNPEIGQKITADNFDIDMSDVDPRFIMGNVDLINPNAIKYNDLNKEEKIQFGQRVLDQKIDQLTSFYKSANFDDDIINEITEALQFGSYRSEQASKPTIGIAEKKGVGFKSGGGVEITPLPRVNFSNGGATGTNDNFLKELEFYFTNEDAELPKIQSYKETMNPIEVLNDIIDPRNYPYYADVLARSGVRIGEFATRILPATGKLVSDLIQKPAFKITGTGSNYVQDHTELRKRILPFKIKGTGIFSEFLENITPTATEKFVGLDKLIKEEEQKQKDRGMTVGPKVFADTIGLGAEVTAPVFPGLKLLRAYAKKKNLPVDTSTQKLLVKEIDETLESRGMTRREFLQTTGAGATVILAKILGLGDEVAQTAKVAEKVAAAPAGAPSYFFDLVEIIKRKGLDTTKRNATQNLQNVFSYKGYDLYEDLATGELRIEKTNTGIIRSGDDVEEGIRSQDVLEYKPARKDADPDSQTTLKDPEEYNEGSVFPDVDGKMKEVEDLDIDELLEFIKNEKAN